MKCRICQKEFEGRPNKLYCGIPCRRQQEKELRERRQEETMEERNIWDLPTDWGKNKK